MPLFAMSGLSSKEKKEAFLGIVREMEKEYTVYLVLQEEVGENTREEISKLRSAVANRMRPNTLVCVYAPLHIKSMRYEIFSIAKNTKMEMCHVFYKGKRSEEGFVAAKEEEVKQWETMHISPAGKKEAAEVVERIFEVPRESDKWDKPELCLTQHTLTKEQLLRISQTLKKEQKKRTSCTKIIPQSADPLYLSKTKAIMEDIMKEEKERRALSLKTTREIEGNFLASIRLAPPEISHVRDIFKRFIEEALREHSNEEYSIDR